MAKNYKELGKRIITCMGGADNVDEIYHCATRLRIQIADMEKADLEAVKNVAGVMGAVEVVGGVQVIIGNEVSRVYAEIMKMYHIKTRANVKENLDGEQKQNIVAIVMNTMSAIITPVIPLIMCSGLISALLVVLAKLGLSTESSTYAIVDMTGKAAMYFMPVFLAYSASARFNCNRMISVFLGALLISPTLIGLTEAGNYVTLFGLPVKTMDYTSSVIPIILTVWVFHYIEKAVNKIVPPALKFVIHPLICVIIMLPVMLCITGPIGGYIGNLLANLLLAVHATVPWAPVIIISCLAPLMIITGMHMALTPLIMFEFTSMGYDSCMFVAFIGMNFSQFGVALACLLKTKNKNLRALASSCAITVLLSGVTEPTLYGICVRMKKPLIATWIACVVNGIFCSITSVKAFVFGAPSFFTMPMFISPDGNMSNLYFAVAAAVITIIVSFAATWMIGFDDRIYGEA